MLVAQRLLDRREARGQPGLDGTHPRRLPRYSPSMQLSPPRPRVLPEDPLVLPDPSPDPAVQLPPQAVPLPITEVVQPPVRVLAQLDQHLLQAHPASPAGHFAHLLPEPCHARRRHLQVAATLVRRQWATRALSLT